MSFIAAAIIGGGAAIIGGGLSAYGSLTASGQQQALGQQALQQQQGFFNQAKGGLQPFIDAGTGVIPTLQKFTQPGANQTQALSQLPGFQFAQDWGQKAVQNIGTTQGLGGNTLTAGAQFATGLAQQNWTQYLQPLLAQLQVGQGAAGSLAGSAGTFSGQASNTLTGIGQAQAAGTLGATNAIGGALTGGANAYTNSLLLSKLFGGGTSPNSPNALGVYGGNPVQYGGGPYQNAFA